LKKEVIESPAPKPADYDNPCGTSIQSAKKNRNGGKADIAVGEWTSMNTDRESNSENPPY
jgi:hypothetical protein